MAFGKKDRGAPTTTTSSFVFGDDAVQAPGASEARAMANRAPGAERGAGERGYKLLDGPDAQVDGPIAEREAQSLFKRDKRQKDPLGPDYGYDRKLFGRNDEVSVYTEQMNARYRMDPRTRSIIILAVTIVVLIPLMLISPTGWLTQFHIGEGVAGWVETLQSNLRAISNLASGIEDGNGIRIVIWQTLAVALVGAALATNGAVYQGALKNALASPSTLGVMSGGTLGGIVYMLVFESQEVTTLGADYIFNSQLVEEYSSLSTFDYIVATQGRALCSVVGCFVVVGLVLLIAYIAGRGKVSKAALVIAGQVFAAVISGVISVIRYYISVYGTEEQIEAMRSMVGGSISNIVGPLQFALVAIPLVVGIAIVMAMRGRLNLLAFNDEEARSMGISVAWTRNTLVAVCTIMTAVVVSFCGNVGFVGFLVPHLARKMVGPDLRYLVPATALLGSIYLLISNYVMRLGDLLNGSLGSFTSLIGVAFFLVAIVQQRRRGNVDWI